MKAFTFFSVAFAAGFAMAAVTSDATFGVLKVDSDAAETVICVPWEAAGGGNVAVVDLVKTTDLTKGSDEAGTGGDVLLLYRPSESKYYGWALNNAGTWVGVAIVTGKGTSTAGTTQTLARGDALIIRRSNTSPSIYLYGQYNATAATAPTLTAGAWHLIAPPSTSGADLSLNSMTWNNVDGNDYIYLQSTSTGNRIKITRNKNGDKPNSMWVYRNWNGTETTDLASVKAGQGFWYVSTGATTPTVSF
ncbi:MAG: hypothetical protein IKO64_04580 [Kiritimatiellae bacterium]|nr:hypothetical protein [Kiritimatiellia bacterium]